MKRLSNIFKSTSPVYAAPLRESTSTDDLSEGFGKKFIIQRVTKNSESLQTSKPLEDCWLDVSVAGVAITDRDDRPLEKFALSKINVYEVVGRTSGSPAFRFTYHNGNDFDTYDFSSPQSEDIFTTLKKAIEKVIEDDNSRSNRT